MKNKHILWGIVLGSMLATNGCGDGGGGTGGANGAPRTTCEAVCQSTCAYQGIDPDQGYDLCLSQCVSVLGDQDECGPQYEAYISCVEARNCDFEAAAAECQSLALAWSTCLVGI
jgi:hypothetical protein